MTEGDKRRDGPWWWTLSSSTNCDIDERVLGRCVAGLKAVSVCWLSVICSWCALCLGCCSCFFTTAFKASASTLLLLFAASTSALLLLFAVASALFDAAALALLVSLLSFWPSSSSSLLRLRGRRRGGLGV